MRNGNELQESVKRLRISSLSLGLPIVSEHLL